MNVAKVLFTSLAAVLFAGPVRAVTVAANGVVIFTQADVMAGGITPGDTPGFPASILVPGSYQLGSPLSVTTLKNGIVVSASAVTIDLNGFKISGNNAGRNGIYSQQIDTTVRNGIVKGFLQNGIQSTAGLLVVERIKATQNGISGIVDTGSAGNSRIIDNLASGNGYYGIQCGNECRIQGNTVTHNNSGVYTSGLGIVLGNLITGNVNYGLNANRTGYGNNTIVGNGGSVAGTAVPMQPNTCDPACP